MVLAAVPHAPAQSKKNKQAKPADKTSYVVFHVRKDRKDPGQFKVMESSEAKAFYDTAKKEHTEATKAWNKQRVDHQKDRANRGKKFTQPKPIMPQIRVVRQNIKSMEEANKIAAESQRKLTERAGAAKPKKKPTR